jgi:hypothetical protein
MTPDGCETCGCPFGPNDKRCEHKCHNVWYELLAIYKDPETTRKVMTSTLKKIDTLEKLDPISSAIMDKIASKTHSPEELTPEEFAFAKSVLKKIGGIDTK